MNTTEQKRRGRPAGSVSFQNVKLSDLIEKYGPDTILPVGRLWLEKSQATFTPVTQTAATVQPSVDTEEKIEFTLVD